jgi:hypothetical protein
MSSTDTVSLSTLKIASGFLLALSAFLGSLVPELLLRSSKPGEFQSTILPIGNALSAGLLFGAGMLHFFAEGTSQLSAISMLASKGNKSEFTISSEEYVANIREGTGSGFGVAAPAMMLGYILSLVIDRVVLEKLKRNKKLPDWLSQHSHSHGTPEVNQNGLDHHHHGHASQVVTSPNAITRGNFEKEDVNVVEMARDKVDKSTNENHPMEENVDHCDHHHANANLIHQHHPTASSSSSSTSTILTIAVLMSLHSAIEGTTLALETSAKTLRGAFIPLFIHRFFDGVVVGLQATVVSELVGGSGDNKEKNSENPLSSLTNFFAEMKRIVFRKETMYLFGWSIITPVVLILVLMANSLEPDQKHDHKHSPESSGAGHSHSHGSATTSYAGAWAQCFAAGSFVYISGELLNDVFSKSSLSVMMMTSAKDWISAHIGNMNARVLGLFLGICIVLLLEATEG